jgi:hypothetical protein
MFEFDDAASFVMRAQISPRNGRIVLRIAIPKRSIIDTLWGLVE